MAFLTSTVLLVLAGCTTFRYEVSESPKPLPSRSEPAMPKPNREFVFKVVKKPSYLEIKKSVEVLKWNSFEFRNNSSSPVTISFSKSILSATGKSFKLISGQTIGMHKDRDSPDFIIAPGTSADLSFFPLGVDFPIDTIGGLNRFSISYQKENDQKSNYIQIDSERPYEYEVKLSNYQDELSKIRLAEFDRIDKMQTNKKRIVEVPIGTFDKVLCYVTGTFYGGWCWLISPTDDHDAEAQKQAEATKAESTGELKLRYLGKKAFWQ
jgi:hypothetical protein